MFPASLPQFYLAGKERPHSKEEFYQSCKKEQEQKDRDSSLFKRTTHPAHIPTCNYSIQMPLLWREWLSRDWRCKRRETVEKDRKLWTENLQASLRLPTCWALSLKERCVSHWHAKNKDPQTLPDLGPKVRERKAKKTKASRRDLQNKAVKMDFMVLQQRKGSGWKRSCLLLNFNADDGTRGHT